MKVLFIRFSSLGDVILTTGVLRYIKENAPNVEINVLTFNEFAPVFEGLQFVEKIYTVPKGVKLTEYISFLRAMPAFDNIIDWHDNLRSRIAGMILRGKVSVYDKQSLARRMYVRLRLCRNKLAPHTVLRYAKAALPLLGISVPEIELLRPYLPNSAGTVSGKVVLHPFASKQTKIWPYFAALAEELVKSGKDVYVVGKGDFPAVKGVKLLDTPRLSDLFAALGDAELVISTDSGPMHAAVALCRPLVAIFGSTTRELGFFPVFSGCSIIERAALNCRPCHVHGLDKCPMGHFKCMLDISVADMLAILR